VVEPHCSGWRGRRLTEFISVGLKLPTKEAARVGAAPHPRRREPRLSFWFFVMSSLFFLYVLR
jgi:hypothetical protein